MISIPTMLDKRIKDAAPPKSAWVEAWGFLLLGTGVFLALACYSFSPSDYSNFGVLQKVDNLAGPWGAWLSRQLLSLFGVTGLLWPIVFIVWGGLTITGFVLVPKARRFIGFVILTAVLAGYAELLLPLTELPLPTFGFGGNVGSTLKMRLMPQLGFGGSLVALAIFGLVAQVLVGNLELSRTADVSKEASQVGWKKFKLFWKRHILNQDGYKNAPGMSRNVRVPEAYVKSNKTRRPGPKNSTPTTTQHSGDVTTNMNVSGDVSAHEENAATGLVMSFDYKGNLHANPAATMFSKSSALKDMSKTFKEKAEYLTKQLEEFKIMGKVTDVTQGPVVTTYEFSPAPGTKLSKISALGDDLARMLKAQSLRVLTPIPGKDTVGFEVPNPERAMIGFRDLVENKDFKSPKLQLPIAMGADIFGKPIFADLANMPHLLVAGSTGSGKSVFMNTLIGSLICRHQAKDLRFVMIDPKMVEMAAYNDLPHMACPVITDPAGEALDALTQLVAEMDERYHRMRSVGARNITSFNQIIKSKKKSDFKSYKWKWTPMPYIVLIIDELADMMMVLGKDAEAPITRLAQKARACGIHLVIATQRPSAEVVTGLIKANFPTRVAFKVLSGIDSRTILDQSGAETLLGKGDMLFLEAGGAKRIHGAFLSEDEVAKMVDETKRKK